MRLVTCTRIGVVLLVAGCLRLSPALPRPASGAPRPPVIGPPPVQVDFRFPHTSPTGPQHVVTTRLPQETSPETKDATGGVSSSEPVKPKRLG